MICFGSGVSPEWQPNPKQIWFGQNKVAESPLLWGENSVNKHPHPMNRTGELNIPGFLGNILSYGHRKYSSFPLHFHKRPSSLSIRQKCDKNCQCLCLNYGMQHMSTKHWITEGSLEQVIPCPHHSWNKPAVTLFQRTEHFEEKQYVPCDVSPRKFWPIYGSVHPPFALWGSFIT